MGKHTSKPGTWVVLDMFATLLEVSGGGVACLFI